MDEQWFARGNGKDGWQGQSLAQAQGNETALYDVLFI